MKPCIVVATGGTGGHIFPALAVAEALKDLVPGLHVHFVGGQGMEARLAAQAGLTFTGLPVEGVVGRGLKSVAAAARLARAFKTARRVLRELSPLAVAGFGGYAGFTPVAAAASLRIPTSLHEQNSFPGVANRLLSRMVKSIFISYPDEHRAFDARKTCLTGNPVRAAIAAMAEAPAKTAFGRELLVLGGSQGAKAVNEAVLAAAPALTAAGVRITHQTGTRHEADIRQAYAAKGLLDSVRVAAFLDDMPAAYAGADLLVSRAGATTLAEIACVGLPAVLVPFPAATNDHQTFNARALASAKAAVLLPQRDCSPETLTQTVLECLDAPQRLTAMSRALRGLAKPHAATRIAKGILALTTLKPLPKDAK